MAAGAGDLSDGFREMLAVYVTLWNAGLRPGQIDDFLKSDITIQHNDSVA
jgi:hypothetical protein